MFRRVGKGADTQGIMRQTVNPHPDAPVPAEKPLGDSPIDRKTFPMVPLSAKTARGRANPHKGVLAGAAARHGKGRRPAKRASSPANIQGGGDLLDLRPGAINHPNGRGGHPRDSSAQSA